MTDLLLDHKPKELCFPLENAFSQPKPYTVMMSKGGKKDLHLSWDTRNTKKTRVRNEHFKNHTTTPKSDAEPGYQASHMHTSFKRFYGQFKFSSLKIR